MMTLSINWEKNVSKVDLFDQFKKVIMCYKCIGCNIHVM